MDAKSETPTEVTRLSDLETVITRRFDAPARLVFRAWTEAGLMQRWWVPKSFPITLLSCEIDARTGGKYRFTFGHPAAKEPIPFFGRYIEVTPHARIVWTNEESDEGSISTLTLTETAGQTLVTLHELYPSKAALDEAIASGSTSGMPEQLQNLAEMLDEFGGGAG